MEFTLRVPEFNYVIVGHVNDGSRKIQAQSCACRPRYTRRVFDARCWWPRYLEIPNAQKLPCGILLGRDWPVDRAARGTRIYARAIFSRSREYLPISVANSHTAHYLSIRSPATLPIAVSARYSPPLAVAEALHERDVTLVIPCQQ